MVLVVRRLPLLLALVSCAGETSFESEPLPYSFEIDSVRVSGEISQADGGVSTTLVLTNLTDQAIEFDGLDECVFFPTIHAPSWGRLVWAPADSPLISECRVMTNVWQIEAGDSVRFSRFVKIDGHDVAKLQARFTVLVRDADPVDIAPRLSPR